MEGAKEVRSIVLRGIFTVRFLGEMKVFVFLMKIIWLAQIYKIQSLTLRDFLLE
jgi:hypothetical protein